LTFKFLFSERFEISRIILESQEFGFVSELVAQKAEHIRVGGDVAHDKRIA
jgi:hypothetical protein